MGTCCSTGQILDDRETATTTPLSAYAWLVVPWVTPNIYLCPVQRCPSDTCSSRPSESRMSFIATRKLTPHRQLGSWTALALWTCSVESGCTECQAIQQ